MARGASALVIGGGPAGLMAAETMARAGLAVTLADRMPSLGRKLLMAGKSGLNLTRDEPRPALLARYDAPDLLEGPLGAFDAAAVMAWARGLGQEVFTGSTGRVFPVAMKASPLLRAWLSRLDGLGVTRHTRWTLTAWDATGFTFETPAGMRCLSPDVAVLALGGASWARLGSDGAWTKLLSGKVPTTPFAASNGALRVDWSAAMARHFGAPVKATAIETGTARHRGEFVISKDGLEGGGIYAVSRAVREGRPLTIDLLPDLPLATVAGRLSRPRGKASLSNHLRKTLRLDPVRLALLREWGGPLPDSATDLAATLKRLPLRHRGPAPLDRAISTTGGIARAALTPGLMLKDHPGVFAAGEMIDWDAPTGGYLITACLATGYWAGHHAAACHAG